MIDARQSALWELWAVSDRPGDAGDTRILTALVGAADAQTLCELRHWAIATTAQLLAVPGVALFEFEHQSYVLHVTAARGERGPTSSPPTEYGRLARAANDGCADFQGVDPSIDGVGLLACVPVRTETAVLGILAIYGHVARPHLLTSTDRTILLAIGREAGRGLDRLAPRSPRVSPSGGVRVA